MFIGVVWPRLAARRLLDRIIPPFPAAIKLVPLSFLSLTFWSWSWSWSSYVAPQLRFGKESSIACHAGLS